LINKIKEKQSPESGDINNTNQLEVSPRIETESPSQYDFRKTTWGMSQIEVEQAEEGVSVFQIILI